MKVTIKTLKNRAEKFRNSLAHQPTGGVVVFYNGKAVSWVDELRNPESWEPGVIAMNAEGNFWRATGGDAYNGAKEWQPLQTQQQEQRA